MAWFDVGCIGLFTLNIFALIKFTKDTSVEAYEVVYIVNFVMHLLWGAHNAHLVWAEDGLRRPYPLLFYSLFGACGSGALRNYYALSYGTDTDDITNYTCIVEWGSLGIILLDLLYFLMMERHEWDDIVIMRFNSGNGKKNKTN